MSSSSDWLTALDERSRESGIGLKTLNWLPDFSAPSKGFEEGFPALRPQTSGLPEQRSEPLDEASDETLVDILRGALGEPSDEKLNDMIGDPVQSETADAMDTVPAIHPLAEAFERGLEAGREETRAQQLAEEQQSLALRQTFRALDQAAMDALAGELAETVIALCTQTLADFIPEPGPLKQRCLEAAKRLGSGGQGATLYLHPDDLTLLDQAGFEGWKLVSDPAAERGGLRLETADGSVSDRPEDWRRAIAAAIRG